MGVSLGFAYADFKDTSMTIHGSSLAIEFLGGGELAPLILDPRGSSRVEFLAGVLNDVLVRLAFIRRLLPKEPE